MYLAEEQNEIFAMSELYSCHDKKIGTIIYICAIFIKSTCELISSKANNG